MATAGTRASATVENVPIFDIIILFCNCSTTKGISAPPQEEPPPSLYHILTLCVNLFERNRLQMRVAKLNATP